MAFKRPPDFAPGAEYEYNNTNYYLLGLVAEKIDGKPLAAVFQDRLFGPLGMKDTVLPAPESNTIPEPFTHGYLYGSTSYALADAPYPADLVAAAKAGTLEPNDDTFQNPSAYFAAGGVISTADDLATWMRALVGGKVFDAEMQKQWLASPEAPVPGEPAMQKYGYGILTLSFGRQHDLLPRGRDARLPVVHGLRSGERHDAGDLDQPDPRPQGRGDREHA